MLVGMTVSRYSSIRQGQHHRTRKASYSPALFPLSDTEPSSVDEVAKKFALYFDDTTFVVSGRVEETYVSYSAGNYIDWNNVAAMLEWNKRHEALVRSGRAIFLPAEFVLHDEMAAYSGTTVYRAPLIQDPLTARLVPANSFERYPQASPTGQILAFGHVMLPYFPGVSIEELIKVAENETEAFTRFTYRLRQLLSEIPSTNSAQELERIVQEIKYHEAGLELETKKLRRAKFLAGTGLAFFSVCLSTLIFQDSELIKQIAGFLGSAALIDNVRSMVDISNTKTAMKGDDFYVPYLLNRGKG
jgi:hypothetical protein